MCVYIIYFACKSFECSLANQLLELNLSFLELIIAHCKCRNFDSVSFISVHDTYLCDLKGPKHVRINPFLLVP